MKKILACMLVFTMLLSVISTGMAITNNEYRVSISKSIGGKVSGEARYEVGENVKILAQPNDKYAFKCWKNIEGIELKDVTNPEVNFKMPNNKVSMKAEFAKKLNKVNVRKDGRGTVEGEGSYNVGDVVVISAGPKEGYKFVGWNNIEGIEIESTETEVLVFKMPLNNVTLTAVFEKDLSASSDEGNTFLKDKLSIYFEDILNNYLGTTDDADTLVTVFTDLSEEDWSFDAIKTLISQLTKALLKTTSGIPTQEDLDALTTQLGNGELYYPDFPGQEKVYTSIKDICRFCNFPTMFNSMYNSTGSVQITDEIVNPNPEGRPISIGKLNNLHWKNPTTGEMEDLEDVWFVGLAGTGFIDGQSSGLVADILSGCEADSPYLQKTLEAITTKVPKGSKIILAGFSLGGMMAQQVMVQDVILENYEIIQVTALGCPPLCVDERVEAFEKYNVNFPINRVIDEYDLIPYLCTDYLRGKLEPTSPEIKENLLIDSANPRYKTFVGTHFIGYLKEACWDNYDALGYKVENEAERSLITLDLGNFEFFDAPTQYLPDDLSKFE